MARRVLTVIGFLLGLAVGYYTAVALSNGHWSVLQQTVVMAVGGMVVASLGYLLTPWLRRLTIGFRGRIETRVATLTASELVWGALGAIIGLVAGYLLALPVSFVPLVGPFLPIFVSVILGYAGLVIGMKKRDELTSLRILPSRGRLAPKAKAAKSPDGPVPKVLDTSAIIDGRISDILESGFVEGPIIIPSFVLEELRHVADSADDQKRQRGRHGLDMLKRIRKDHGAQVQVMDDSGDDRFVEVDSRLLNLAKSLGGVVITTDYNLNKVAAVRGVGVLNVNLLANAVRPVLLPGEDIEVTLIREGKEEGQGVAYLPDGTMIVVEQGRTLIGETVAVTVTSALQTAAGRMIFAKPRHAQQHATGQVLSRH
ncbi:MAG: PIN domain-containing protein [Sulfobacillus sp.]